MRTVPAPPVRGRRPSRRRIRTSVSSPSRSSFRSAKLQPLTVRVAAVRCIEHASGLFRHASRITSRNDAPDVDTSRSSTTSTSRSSSCPDRTTCTPTRLALLRRLAAEPPAAGHARSVPCAGIRPPGSATRRRSDQRASDLAIVLPSLVRQNQGRGSLRLSANRPQVLAQP